MRKNWSDPALGEPLNSSISFVWDALMNLLLPSNIIVNSSIVQLSLEERKNSERYDRIQFYGNVFIKQS